MPDFFRPESENTYLGWLRQARPDVYAAIGKRPVARDVLIHVLEHVDWNSGALCWASTRHLAAGANNNGKGHHTKQTRDALAFLCDLGVLSVEPRRVKTGGTRGQAVKAYRVQRPTIRGAEKAPTSDESRALSTPKVGAFHPQGGRFSPPRIHDSVLGPDPSSGTSSLLSHESGGEKRPPSEKSDTWTEGDAVYLETVAGAVLGQITYSGRVPFFLCDAGAAPLHTLEGRVFRALPAALSEQPR